ncbi:MAG: hypothetical protein ACT4OS_03370 [Acidimicrobiales bacterium]
MARDAFGRGKDSARREELERQAQEEVERLTRRSSTPGGMGPMPGPGGGGGQMGVGPPSALEMMAQQMRQRRKPRESGRGDGGFTNTPTGPRQVMAAGLISGSVGSGFGPAGLNPGPAFARSMNPQPPPTAFAEPEFDMGRGGYEAPPMPSFDPDMMEEEEMNLTEMAIRDQAARSGTRPEDLVVNYDPESAEEARDRAMRQFHERQQQRGRSSLPLTASMARDPFAPAAMRNQAASAIADARASGPPPTPTVGGALGRLAAQRRSTGPDSGPTRRPALGRGSAPARGRQAPPATPHEAPPPGSSPDAASPTTAPPAPPSPMPLASPSSSPASTQPTSASADPARSGVSAEGQGSPVADRPAAEAGGALARLIARRRSAQFPSEAPTAPEPAVPEAPGGIGSLHSRARAESRSVVPDVAPAPAASRPARARAVPQPPAAEAAPARPAPRAAATKAPRAKATSAKPAPVAAKPAPSAAATAATKAPRAKAPSAKPALAATKPAPRADATKAPRAKAPATGPVPASEADPAATRSARARPAATRTGAATPAAPAAPGRKPRPRPTI